MSKVIQTRQKLIQPELFLGELIRKYAQGKFLERDDSIPILFRAVVVAVDAIGGKLENKDGKGVVSYELDNKNHTFNANVGPSNPKNSIKARIITEGFDQFFADNDLRVFWPFFPEHITLPIKPGEHVYIMFEDNKFEHGLWVCKIPGHENVNFYRGQNSFSKEDKKLSGLFADTAQVKKEDKSTNTDAAASERLVNDDKLRNKF
jgi:hypothetical protein